MKKIYADCAATTKISDKAKEAMLSAFEIYGNPSSLHTFGVEAARLLTASREKIAELIGADPGEIYFTSGGSESDNQALFTIGAEGKKKSKNRVISTTVEHHAILHTMDRLKRGGFDTVLCETDRSGSVEPKDIEALINDDCAGISVMYANNEIGTIEPIQEIAGIAAEHKVLFHTDAVQAAGHLPINVVEQNIDLASVSSHKFHGPKGVGILYARRGIALTGIIEGGAQERGKRAGTENMPAIVGMAAALEYACAHIEQDSAYVTSLRDKLIAGLSRIPHSALNGDPVNRLPGNVSFCFEGIEGESLLLLLDAAGICASSGSACTSGLLDPSHVLLAIGRPHEVAHGSLRLTIDAGNTEEEIDRIIEAVPAVVERLRDMSPVWSDLVSGKKNFIL